MLLALIRDTGIQIRVRHQAMVRSRRARHGS